MRKSPAAPVLLLLALPLVATGCMISEQVGERTHVNSPPPETMTFHFDTAFNKMMWLGRSAALLFIPLWAFGTRRGSENNLVPLVFGVLAAIASAWLLVAGFSQLRHYRIDVDAAALHVAIPRTPERVIEWKQIERLDGEGSALNVDLGAGSHQVIEWAPQWEDLTLSLVGGERFSIDLRPLSVEQRGTLCWAIVRRAGLEGKVVIKEL